MLRVGGKTRPGGRRRATGQYERTEYALSHAPQEISNHLVLEMVGPVGPTPIEAELRYSPTDPYAVAVVFHQGGTEVEWFFGRDLLMRGVSEPAGAGDVQVFPTLDAEGRALVGLMLHAPGGRALIHAPSKDVLEFLARTTLVVWPGTESDYISADDTIAALLVGD